MNQLLKVLGVVCLVLVSMAAALFIWQNIGTKPPTAVPSLKTTPAGKSETTFAPDANGPIAGAPALFTGWFTVPRGRFFLGSTKAEVLEAQGSPSKQPGAQETWSWEGGRVDFDSNGRVRQFLDYRGVRRVDGQPVSQSPLRIGANPVGAKKQALAIGSSVASVLARCGMPVRAESTTEGVFFEYQSNNSKSGWLRFTSEGVVDIIESNGFFDGFYGHRDAHVPETRGE